MGLSLLVSAALGAAGAMSTPVVGRSARVGTGTAVASRVGGSTRVAAKGAAVLGPLGLNRDRDNGIRNFVLIRLLSPPAHRAVPVLP